MSIRSHILTAMLMAGVAVAQSAPASQTVQNQPSSPQPSKVQKGISAVKGALKNPFAPKTKAATPAGQTPAKPQAKSNAQPTPAAAKKVAPAQAKTTPATKVAPAAKTAAPVQAKVTPKKKATPVQAKATPKKKAAPVHAEVVKAPAPVKPAEPAPAVAQSAPAKLPNPGKRDPFLTLLAAKGPAATCSTGKRCLAVDQIVLRGVVVTKNGNIAMVENEAKRSYYLHENDALFDGSVVKITGDSVTFRQESSDVLGRPVSKEVVKRVTTPAV